MDRKERWTDYDDQVRAAMRAPTQAATDSCLEPETLMALVEQGGKHPQAGALLRHVLDCASCGPEYQEMRRTLAVAEQARTLQQTVTSPQPKAVVFAPEKWWERLLPRRGLTPAWGLAAAAALVFLVVVTFRSFGPADKGPTVVALSDGLPPELLQRVQLAMNTGDVKIAALNFDFPATRGGDELSAVSPDRTLVLSPDTVLRWDEKDQAGGYHARIWIEKNSILFESDLIHKMEWRVPAGLLKPDKTYYWEVTAVAPGTSRLSEPAAFRVASPAERAEIERARRAHPADRLFMAALLATRGFLDDAEAELEPLGSDPKAAKMLGSIRAQREGRAK